MSHRRDPIVLVEHDPAWTSEFEDQRRALTPLLAPHLVRLGPGWLLDQL
ncbi:hypothetical protein [Nocardioides hungaricus]